MKTFEAFNEQFNLNPDKYVKDKDSVENPITCDELRNDIYENFKKEQKLKELIPEAVVVSMF